MQTSANCFCYISDNLHTFSIISVLLNSFFADSKSCLSSFKTISTFSFALLSASSIAASFPLFNPFSSPSINPLE